MYNWEFESVEKKTGRAPKVVPVKDKEKSGTAGGSDDSSVECELNSIYFYSSVTQQDNFTLNKYLAKLSRDLPILQSKYKLERPINIHLRINSYGGSVFAALSTIDTIIKRHGYPRILSLIIAETLSITCCIGSTLKLVIAACSSLVEI